jgi:hypothetical protein
MFFKLAYSVFEKVSKIIINLMLDQPISNRIQEDKFEHLLYHKMD